MRAKRYIGDGMYAEIDEQGSLVLTTEDGMRVTNRIVLEPEVWDALLHFMVPARKGAA